MVSPDLTSSISKRFIPALTECCVQCWLVWSVWRYLVYKLPARITADFYGVRFCQWNDLFGFESFNLQSTFFQVTFLRPGTVLLQWTTDTAVLTVLRLLHCIYRFLDAVVYVRGHIYCFFFICFIYFWMYTFCYMTPCALVLHSTCTPIPYCQHRWYKLYSRAVHKTF